MAKHIQTLEMLLLKRNQEIQFYLDELKSRYEELSRTGYCRDDIVDSILLVTAKQCEDADISLKIQVEDTFYGEIHEMDLVGLLYNLLDNAREANVRIPDEGERGISFSMGKHGKRVWIEMENYFSAEETMDFKTKKKGKDQHGMPYGLAKFVRFAKNVWDVDATGKTDEQVASEGLQAMENWMKELGLVMNITELGATEDMIPDLVKGTIVLPGGYKVLDADEIEQIFRESF